MATVSLRRCAPTSPRRAPLPSASDALTPPEALVARFRGDLSRLFAVDHDRLLVAVSGGADSVALLLLAHAALGDRCMAATVDHRLRAESAEEARFVAEICRTRGISHQILSGAFPARSGRTANLSARARTLRYELLAAERERVGATATATAHHIDDQVETLAMRLDRGAGLAGLAGIRAIGPGIVRPLLNWRRAELAAIVSGCGIEPVRDPSNTDDRFDRARMRKALASADWLDPAGWASSAAALADAQAALEWTATHLAQSHCRFGEGWAAFSPADLPFELNRRLVARCLVHVDPAIEPRGPDLIRLIERVSHGAKSTLGGVQVTPAPDGSWQFTLSPPRRSH